MKTLKISILPIILLMMCSSINIQAQNSSDTAKTYIIVKNDGTEFMGKIISQDAREVMIETKNVGQVIIPKHEIKEIKEVKSGDMHHGVYIQDEVFSTRYFITTNGLPIEKGESYIQWNLFGPDFQFGVAKNFGLGVMTTWLAVPVIVSAKYSIPIQDDINLGVGLLAGTGSWASPDFLMGLPFAALTLGNRKTNVNISGGFGAIRSRTVDVDFDPNTSSSIVTSGRILFSVAGMTKVGRKVSLVFDSFIMPATGGDDNGWGLLIPGIRLQTESKKAFQFGFGAMFVDGELLPLPIPCVQWYRQL